MNPKRIIKKIIIIFFILLGVSALGAFVFFGIYINTHTRTGISGGYSYKPTPILADKVSVYLEPEPGDTITYGFDTGYYDYSCNYQYTDIEERKANSKTYLEFILKKEDLVEQKDETGTNLKIYHKIDDSWVDITPLKAEMKEIPNNAYMRVSFTFYALEELEEGNFYKIEYGPNTIEFMMGVEKTWLS